MKRIGLILVAALFSLAAAGIAFAVDMQKTTPKAVEMQKVTPKATPKATPKVKPIPVLKGALTVISARTIGANPSSTNLLVKVKNNSLADVSSGTVTVKRSYVNRQCTGGYTAPPPGQLMGDCLGWTDTTVNMPVVTIPVGAVNKGQEVEVHKGIQNLPCKAVITVEPGSGAPFNLDIHSYIY
ncbi:MAG: hypothetical protein WCX84_06960 [Syntrophales bacterium]|jgi:hypothetical protein|nr:hypothetical protein [Syntrophales bacterium]